MLRVYLGYVIHLLGRRG